MYSRPRLLLPLAMAAAATLLLLLSVPAPVRATPPPVQEICFGVVLPLTSDRHIESLRIMDAIQMAADDINADPTLLPNSVIHILTTPTDLIDSHGFVRYGARQMHEQAENGACQNGSSVVAVIGDIVDDVCEQMATVSALLNVPMISPGCRDGKFDAREDGVAYPMFARTIPNMLAEADVIKALMSQFQFPQVVLWHSDSTLGSSLGHSFANTDFEVVDVPVPYTDTGVEVQRSLDRILTLRVRIIFIHAEETLGRLMMATANRNGLLNGDYLFFGSSLWTFGADEAHRVEYNEDERTYLQGVVGISLESPDPLVAEHFEDRLSSITPSLYAPFNTQEIVSTVWHAYDAVQLLGHAANNLTVRGVPVTGTALMGVIRSGGVQFQGIVGDRVRMLPDGGLDPQIAITNFVNGKFVTVAHWAVEGLVLTSPIVWPGNNAELNPSPDVPRRLLKLDGSLPDAALSVMVILLMASLGLHYLIHVNRNHEVIKASSPMFCHIIVFGSTLAYVMCGVASLSFTTYCRVVPPFISCAFSTIFAALLAKTYRIHRIFNSEGLKINAPTSAYLLATTAAVAGYDVIVSVIFMVVDAPQPVNIPSPNDDTTQYPECGMNQAQAWLLVYILPKTLMLAFGAWLAYKVRHLNHNFNEAKYISIALYNVIILSAIMLSLVLTFNEVNTLYALKTVGAAVCAFITVCILFVPKFWDIYVTKDWIDYHSNSSYISGVLVHKSSKTGNRTADGILAGVAAGHPAAGVVLAGPGANNNNNNTPHHAPGMVHRKPHNVSGNKGSPQQTYLHRPTKLPSAADPNYNANARRSENKPGGAGTIMRPAGGGDSNEAPTRRTGTLAGGGGTVSGGGSAGRSAKSIADTTAPASGSPAGVDIKTPQIMALPGSGGDPRTSVLTPLPNSSAVAMAAAGGGGGGATVGTPSQTGITTHVKDGSGAVYRVVGNVGGGGTGNVSPSNSPRGGGGAGTGRERTQHSVSLLGSQYKPGGTTDAQTPTASEPLPLSMVPAHGARGLAGTSAAAAAAAAAAATESSSVTLTLNNPSKPLGGGSGNVLSTTAAPASSAAAAAAAAGAGAGRLSPHASMSSSVTNVSTTVAASTTTTTFGGAGGGGGGGGGVSTTNYTSSKPPAPPVSLRASANNNNNAAAAAAVTVSVPVPPPAIRVESSPGGGGGGYNNNSSTAADTPLSALSVTAAAFTPGSTGGVGGGGGGASIMLLPNAGAPPSPATPTPLLPGSTKS